jgi:hypothetical protein
MTLAQYIYSLKVITASGNPLASENVLEKDKSSDVSLSNLRAQRGGSH